MRLAVAILALLATVLVGRSAQAHAFTPFVLELRERAGGAFDAELRRPAGQASPVVQLPVECTVLGDTADRWTARCPHLRGAAIGVTGLDVAEVLVRAHFEDGSVTTGVLRHDGETFVVPVPSPTRDLATYAALGARHVLGGLDHLAFLLVLTALVVKRRRPGRVLAGTITAFTVAHATTLGLVAFDVVRVPTTFTEPLIALSIAVLAAELVRGRTPRGPRPIVAAFGFGLVHGTGFASGLADLGLARAELPRALLGFHVGVELGQLAVVVGVAIALAAVRRIVRPTVAPRFVGYATGALAAAWTLERMGEMVR